MPVSLPTPGGDSGQWGSKLNSYLRSVVLNIQDYGADPTGATSATSAINNAINDAASIGATVYIPQGTYMTTSAILMKSNVTLRGAGYNSLIRKGNYTNVFDVIRNAANDTLNIVIENLRIDGNIANNNDSVIHGGAGPQGGIDIPAGISESLVQNVWVENTGHTGIYLGGPRNKVINCVVKNVGKPGTTDLIGKSGIVAAETGSPDVIISGNYISNIAEHGIKIYNNANYNIVSDNRIEKCGERGIYTQVNSYLLIKGNTVIDSKPAGIFLEDTHYSTITGNTCINNLRDQWGVGYGFLFTRCTNLTVNGNTAIKNVDYGIRMYLSSSCTLAGNVARENGTNIAYDGNTNGGGNII